MKITMKQLKRIIREAIDAVPPTSSAIDKIKMLAQIDPMQALHVAQSFPDYESMDLSFLHPLLLEAIASNIADQIPESSYPEVETAVEGWDIGFEFASRPKRFYAADGMNLTDEQAEERKNQEQELADLAMSVIEDYSDIIKSEFASIEAELVSEEQAMHARGTTIEKTMVFMLMQRQALVEIETFKNTIDIRIMSDRI